MDVALTHPYVWPEVRRGAERIVVETARALVGRGHRVTVLTSSADIGWSTVDGVTWGRLRRRHDDALRHERWFGRAVTPLLAAGRFDAVHSLMPHDAAGAIRARPAGNHRVVYEELGIPLADWWAEQPDRAVREHLVRAVDVYACMSRHAVEVLAHDHGRTGVVVPGGVRLDRFVPADARATRPTLLYSGVLDEPRKGVALLLAAVALVAADEPDVHLWLSGPGDAAALLAAAPDAARTRTEILPIGAPDDQAERYGRAWATVLPSTFESFGMALVESLACGTPIVVADHAAPPELVTPMTGACSVPHDPEALATALRHALTLARDPATAARCRAEAARFDWDGAIAPLLESLYQRARIGPTRR